MYSNHSSDPRRPDKVRRYKPNTDNNELQAPGEDMTPFYMNFLGMILSLYSLLMKCKWAAWCGFFCSCISFANAKVSDDNKHRFSCLMLSMSAIVTAYLQDPLPMSLPWSTIFG